MKGQRMHCHTSRLEHRLIALKACRPRTVFSLPVEQRLTSQFKPRPVYRIWEYSSVGEYNSCRYAGACVGVTFLLFDTRPHPWLFLPRRSGIQRPVERHQCLSISNPESGAATTEEEQHPTCVTAVALTPRNTADVLDSGLPPRFKPANPEPRCCSQHGYVKKVRLSIRCMPKPKVILIHHHLGSLPK